jgi:hypothetical protein
LLKALGVGEVGCRRHDGGDPTGGKAGVQGGCKTRATLLDFSLHTPDSLLLSPLLHYFLLPYRYPLHFFLR